LRSYFFSINFIRVTYKRFFSILTFFKGIFALHNSSV